MGRRVSLYFSWDQSAESSAELPALDNRYPTLFELRRATWPDSDGLADRPKQGVEGFLKDIILRDFESFRLVVEAKTGVPVSLFERVAEGNQFELGAALTDCDTAIVISLDHTATHQIPSAKEIDTARSFLREEGKCLVICPHHYVGAATDGEDASALRARQRQERDHHRDHLVPSQQAIGGFGRLLLEALELPLENRFGLSPAMTEVGDPAPLDVQSELDTTGFLDGVTTFNGHPHLPHFEPIIDSWRVLARQPVNSQAPPHPQFDDAAFNSLLWAPPDDERLGHVLACDATLWSSAFGGVASLQRFWKNIATRG